MEGIEGVERKSRRTRPPRGAARRSIRPHPYSHSFEVRRKAVQLCLEESFPTKQVAREMGVGLSTLSKWVRVYREQGEAGLQTQPGRRGSRRPKMPAVVKTKVVELKRHHPDLGIQKISQFLRRVLFLPVSRETVRRTLHEQQLLKRRKPKPQRNPPKPRFFERSTPNQMWQTDIFTFRLGGKNAYLIGFLDDYSRYVVGLDVFRSQTAEHVLEVYRTAIAEYGVPKEMLSDQGRQYSSWRGTTRFEAELRKDRVHHIKSRPHHPMTLGKIERFWKTIWEEFLVRAQFDSFQSARERVRLWVKHYNHQRPHQSLEGLCPADRFFAIAQELRKVIERGLQENALELALRGQPRSPFYMVGRMGEQSVVIRAEKGKVKMLVEGEEPQPHGEVIYDLEGGTHDRRSQNQEGTAPLQCAATSASGAVDLERAPSHPGSLSGAGDPSQRAIRLGAPGASGDAPGAGAGDAPGAGAGPESETGAVTGAPSLAAEGADGQAGEAVGQAARTEITTPDQVGHLRLTGGSSDERPETRCLPAGLGPAASAVDYSGADRVVECPGGRPAVKDLPQDLLQVGATGLGRDDRGPGQPGTRASAAADRPGEGSTPTPDSRASGEAPSPGADGADPSGVGAA
ncbi:MAG TPA: IS481 family transposase [Candidatus Acidoferrales bacterium]|nr:IS481 family transposase [Candidatus Acidoferrales bacterium]